MTATAPEMGGYQAQNENYPSLRLINGGMSEMEMARAYSNGLEVMAARDGETSLSDITNRMGNLGIPNDGGIKTHTGVIDPGLFALDASIKEEVRRKKTATPASKVAQPSMSPKLNFPGPSSTS